MRSAGVVLAMTLAGCALVHERGGGVADAAPSVDAPPAIDVGPITSCTQFWITQPACPASPDRAIGQPCVTEGETCGVHCCEPGPPILCSGGRWAPLERMDDCRGVRCHGPVPCFDGMCAFNRVCVRSIGETLAPPMCVLLPDPAPACMLPAGSLTTDPTSCTTCTCAPGPEGQSIVTLDCACC